MPTEGRRFAGVDSLWRTILEETNEVKLVMKVCENDKYLKSLGKQTTVLMKLPRV